MGTLGLLQSVTRHWQQLPQDLRSNFRFHHVSTDEVFGDLEFADPAFTESTAYAPSSPYSASKAASDHMVRAWHRTYGLPVTLSNCSNNYGPYNHPEKLIPRVILRALAGASLPVYGAGANIRDWLHVDDHVSALVAILERGVVGQSYNVGARSERSNIDVVRTICALLDAQHPLSAGSYAEQIAFVPDRPGHDLRYAIDGTKLERELGWVAAVRFEAGLADTIAWYLGHRNWWEPILARDSL